MTGQCRHCMRRGCEVYRCSRTGGGTYLRGSRTYWSSICADCAARLLTYATPGHSTLSGWSVIGLRHVLSLAGSAVEPS